MLALKEFANFISLNVANLAITYDQLLVEKGGVDETLPADSRIASARRLIRTVAEACEIGTLEPFCRLFEGVDDGSLPPSVSPKFAQLWLPIECLGQTLTPIVTNLEAGKFLWHMLAEARATVFQAMENSSISPSSLPIDISEKGINKDIPKGKRTEEALRESEERMRRILDNALDAVITIDAEGLITGWNAQAETAFGWSRQEVVGRALSDTIIPAHYREAHQQGLKHFLATGEGPVLNKRIEITALHRNGHELLVELAISPVRWGETITFSAFIRDITERKQIEEALSLTQFTTDRAAFDVVWLGPDAQFLYVNDNACRSSGYSREELLSMTIHDIVADPRSPEIWPAHWAELKQRGSFTFETQHRRKNGEIYPVEVTVNYIEFGGKEYNCAFFRDITERKRLEQQIQGSLERRTRQVQISTEIAQETAHVPALDDLFRRIVNMVQERFGYYYVQIYLFEEGDMILQEGTGEAGRQMKETGYRIPLSAEQSLVVRTIRSGEPVLVPDVSQEPTWLPNPLLPETKAELAVPINLGAELFGVLDVQSDIVGGINEEDQLLLMGLCGQIAVAINGRRVETERERLLAETEARLQEIQALQQFSQDLAGSLQVSGILDVFFRACTQLAGFEYVQFSLVDKNQQRVKAIAGFNVSQDQLRRANHPLDRRDIMTDIVRTGQTEVISGWDDRLDRENFEAEGYADWVRIFTPVTLREENIGLVEAGYNKNVQNIPQDTQIRLLRALIDQIVLALDNAQRYEASQKAAHREQTIREITEKMRAASSLEGLVKTAAEELGRRFSAQFALVDLGTAAPEEDSQQASNNHDQGDRGGQPN